MYSLFFFFFFVNCFSLKICLNLNDISLTTTFVIIYSIFRFSKLNNWLNRPTTPILMPFDYCPNAFWMHCAAFCPNGILIQFSCLVLALSEHCHHFFLIFYHFRFENDWKWLKMKKIWLPYISNLLILVSAIIYLKYKKAIVTATYSRCIKIKCSRNV